MGHQSGSLCITQIFPTFVTELETELRERNELENDYADLCKKCEELKQESEELHQRVKDFDAQLCGAMTRIETLQEERDDVKASLDRLKNAIFEDQGLDVEPTFLRAPLPPIERQNTQGLWRF